MKLYPDAPDRRRRMQVRDGLVVLLVLVFAGVGVRVHSAVDDLSVLGSGVATAGTSVSDAFGAAADGASRLPVVGDRLSEVLSGAGDATGGNVTSLGETGEDSVHRLALVLGLLTFALPTIVLLALTLPRRIRTSRALTAADTVLVDLHDPERRRLLATRAAMSLPYDVLLRHTADPFGDLLAGRLDALVQAGLADAGVAGSATTGTVRSGGAPGTPAPPR
jgi:hypothetical protein